MLRVVTLIEKNVVEEIREICSSGSSISTWFYAHTRKDKYTPTLSQSCFSLRSNKKLTLSNGSNSNNGFLRNTANVGNIK